MKKVKILLTFLILAFIINGCEKDEEKAYVSKNPTANTQQGPASPNGMAFVKADANKYIKFSWSAVNFGFKASVTYGVQLSLTNDFHKSVTILTSQKLLDSAKVGNINAALLTLKMSINVAATVKSRVFATVGFGTDSTFSSVTDYTVTPYETLIDYPMIYVPGAYQGWSPGALNGRLFSYDFNSVYEGIIRLDGGEFKIAPAPNWNNSWGGTLTASGNNYSGVLNPSGGNYSASAGAYKFTVNVTALTIALNKTDDWGIIGGSIPPYDWSVDVDMFYNGQRKMWEVTGDFKAGQFKFRANNGWDLNYGDTGADGSLNAGGDNIVLASDGNYTIRLDAVNLVYQVIKN
ncbi:MAG: SusE domain-containing protein [Bacteroidales bacterium]|nr:SusE domain-containing protein [Bacteroidales bacterium]